MKVLLAVALLLAGCATGGSPEADPDPAPPPPSPSASTPAPTQPPAQPSEQPWDPRRVDDLPAAAPAVAPGLPAVVDPPATAPSLADHPVPAAVLCVQTRRAVLLLAVDGSWRSVPAPPMRRFGGAELTRDGTRVAVETADGVEVWDLPTGDHTRIRAPERSRPWDYSSWRWVDRRTLLLDDWGGGWRVDAASGAAEHTAYPSRASFWWTVDPDGAVVESADWSYPSLLTDWATGEPREIDMAPTGRLGSLHADRDTVVGTSYDNGPFAVHVADRTDLTPRHVLRVRDHEANYSNGGLGIAELLADGTVLLRVTVFGPTISWRLVAWRPRTDALSVVTRGTGALLSFAADRLE